MKRNILILSAIAVVLMSVFTTSCDKEKDKTYGKVMVTHASPNAPGVDW